MGRIATTAQKGRRKTQVLRSLIPGNEIPEVRQRREAMRGYEQWADNTIKMMIEEMQGQKEDMDSEETTHCCFQVPMDESSEELPTVVRGRRAARHNE